MFLRVSPSRKRGGIVKRGRRLTRDEKEVVSSHGYNPNDWMLAEEMEFYLKLVHKETKQIKIIDKFKRGKKR